MKKIFLLLVFILMVSCEKEGIYFDKYQNAFDSTYTVFEYSVYTSNKEVYKERFDTIISFDDIEKIRDSLQEVHKDKINILYIETK